MSAPKELWALVRDSGTVAGVYDDKEDAELERDLAEADGLDRAVRRYVLAPDGAREPLTEKS